MTTKQQMIKRLINAGHEPNEARAEIEFILETVLNKTREELLLIDDFSSKEVENAIDERISTKKPIQYILKKASFMGEIFLVNEDVLIPRDDTEILVREAFKAAPAEARILDIGLGSGAISCALGLLTKKENKNFEIIGVDISTPALVLALNNIKKFNLQKTVMVRKSDIFSNVRENENFDIIVSNPPYIPISELNTIQNEVKFEPKLALFTNDTDGLFFYKKIIKEAPKFLKDGGTLLFEMMKGQFRTVFKLLENENYKEIEIIKDVSGTERVIRAKRPPLNTHA